VFRQRIDRLGFSVRDREDTRLAERLSVYGDPARSDLEKIQARTHLSLAKDAPDGRPIEPPGLGPIIPIPEVGGLHHRYVRRAA
jgi:hypothetical protein